MSTDRVYVRSMPPVLMTAEELLHTSIPDKRVELVRGVLVVREPAEYRHGRVSMKLAFLLSKHVEGTEAGQIVSGDTGFKLASDPDTVRAPDVAFIGRERLPDPQTRGFPALAPDPVVEVLSPDNRPGEPPAKAGDWLEGGPVPVGVITPGRRGIPAVAHRQLPGLVEPDAFLEEPRGRRRNARRWPKDYLHRMGRLLQGHVENGA